MLKKTYKHDIGVVVDRLVASPDILSRVTDSVETALGLAGGVMQVNFVDEEGDAAWQSFSEKLACPNGHPLQLTEIEPRTFSFNAPFGACPTCSGLGTRMSVDVELMLGDEELSIREGVLIPWTTQGKGLFQYYERLLEGLADDLNFSLDTPWNQTCASTCRTPSCAVRTTRSPCEWKNRYGREMRYASGFEGVVPYIERQYVQAESDSQRQRWSEYLREVPCLACNGDRLKPEVLAVLVHGHSIADASRLSLGDAQEYFAQLQLTDREAKIAAQVLREIRARLDFLLQVGLNYLSLSRSAGSLSGGEAQRIRLATQIGSGLTGVLYVLDEPSIGLHQRDNRRLIETLAHAARPRQHAHRRRARRGDDPRRRLGRRHRARRGRGRRARRALRAALRAARREPRSITGDYLAGRRSIETPKKRRRIDKQRSDHRRRRAREQPPQRRPSTFPLGVMTAVTGRERLGQVLARQRHPVRSARDPAERRAPRRGQAHARHRPRQPRQGRARRPGADRTHAALEPGRPTPASSTASATLFSETPEAKVRGYQPGRFSFNVKGGRCEACSGDGTIKIEMNFLPDVYVDCEVCHGKRYNRDTLAVHYKGKNIAEVLEMSIEEAAEFFEPIQAIHRYLRTLVDVGLGYVRLGQSATTLSGGEAQRVKLATELQRRATAAASTCSTSRRRVCTSKTSRRLLEVLNSLVDKGNTVIVIEHNLDVIKSADWIIDLGPEGGSGGGADRSPTGTPEQVARAEGSHTGAFLAEVLGAPRRAARPAEPRMRARPRAAPRSRTSRSRARSRQPRRLPLPRRGRARALRRQGEEPARTAVELLRAAAHAARAHAAHGHDRGIASSGPSWRATSTRCSSSTCGSRSSIRRSTCATRTTSRTRSWRSRSPTRRRG